MKRETKEIMQPGVMLYFDIRKPLELLSDQDRGILFLAIFNYTEYGVLPEFEDEKLEIVWAVLKPKLDRDAENYRETVFKRRYASYCKKEREKNRMPCGYDAWYELYGSPEQVTSDGHTCTPTVNSLSTAEASSAVNADSSLSLSVNTVSAQEAKGASYLSLSSEGKGTVEREKRPGMFKSFDTLSQMSEEEAEIKKQEKIRMLSNHMQNTKSV